MHIVSAIDVCILFIVCPIFAYFVCLRFGHVHMFVGCCIFACVCFFCNRTKTFEANFDGAEETMVEETVVEETIVEEKVETNQYNQQQYPPNQTGTIT